MSTLANFMIVVCADKRPHMLDKLMYESLKSRMEIYIQGLAVPTVLPSDELISCINKAMSFLLAVFSPRYPSTNNQLKSYSYPRNQATVQDGRVTVQQVQGGHGEGYMARECTHPKRRKDASWFKEKISLVQAQAKGKELDEEQLAFLADPRVVDRQVSQITTHNAAGNK
nr:hypothetical protein [Tanacetum cinerariifolium]